MQDRQGHCNAIHIFRCGSHRAFDEARCTARSTSSGDTCCSARWHRIVQPVLAQSLAQTPRQTEGPFFPDRLPLDQDNDLTMVAGRHAPAAGDITDLTGCILDARGNPLRGVVIEIWQVDNNGHYIHTADAGTHNDANFQGYGRFETGQDGAYRFRTIKPVPYPGRTPHIHVKLHKGGHELLTTQMYVRGHPLNERDAILRSIRDPRQRASVLVPFLPSNDRPGELAARFDIVLGMTPAT